MTQPTTCAEPGLWPNLNSFWGALAARVLADAGAREVVLSPGSRSAPLAVGFASEPRLEVIPILDERSAAFHALGLARAHGRPVVLLCTSGTAGANYYPAIIEARQSGVPLLVLTADRPPEMRHCGSGQTIDQLGLFARFPVFQAEAPVPEESPVVLRHWRQLLLSAWDRAQGPLRGPVHLNVPLRDPLAPLLEGEGFRARMEDFLWPISPPPGVLRAREEDAIEAAALAEWLCRQPGNGLIVAGAWQGKDPAAHAASLSALGASLGWPVLADALHPARHFRGASAAVVVGSYDAILRAPRLRSLLRPGFFLQVGPLPTSKVLRSWMEEVGAPRLILREGAENLDPLHGPSNHSTVPLERLVPAVRPGAFPGRDGGWQDTWKREASRCERRLVRDLGSLPWNSEPRLARTVGRSLPPAAAVFLASSLTVRDAEYFWPCSDRRYRVFFNRGANGIDGTLSTASGVARAFGSAFLVTGDLAFLHDVNGLATHDQTRFGLTVVLVNNQGGGIFEHLPIASFEPPFERLFATPQSVEVSHLVRAFGGRFLRVDTEESLRSELARPVHPGLTVLELRTDRKRGAQDRKHVLGQAAS